MFYKPANYSNRECFDKAMLLQNYNNKINRRQNFSFFAYYVLGCRFYRILFTLQHEHEQLMKFAKTQAILHTLQIVERF